jgi:arylsulfatase
MKTTRVRNIIAALLIFALNAVLVPKAAAQEVLPFPRTPSGSTAGRTMQQSKYSPVPQQRRTPPGAPNVLIILMDDVGPATPSTYGGEINTPTLSRVANKGISYNRFHSTAMCSPTRAALLTGRNHHRVGAGQIAELANDFDGYSGLQPKSSAMVPEVLKNYGYTTGAWGKWHNTPANETTAAGPFDFWPTGYGFEYFYGFLAGEASQYEPNLVRNTSYVHPPKTPEQGYHLTTDIGDDAVKWLQNQQAFQPDKPFFMYWAPGAAHGPHHIMKEWADKYKGKFDDGWDKYRERAFARQKSLGWIPQSAKLTPRDPTMASWDSIPENEKPFQRRLMEVYAGFAEHADFNAGRVIDEIEREGKLDNTLIFYIWGDNGSSAEGQNGSISELLAQNGIPTTIQQHIKAVDDLGGLDVLGSPKTDNMYNAGWAWAGSTPYRSTKLVAAHFGGTRQPMAISWPKKIKADKTPRPQFHHVNDIVPTIYEAVGITAPKIVNGFTQDPIDGVSMVYSFNDPKAKGRLMTQYFEIMGSRAIYHDGWIASVFGPRNPWTPGMSAGMATWTPDNDTWELHNLDEDWSQANDLAASNPAKLAELKKLFDGEAIKNKVYPIGGGLWDFLHPEDGVKSPYTEWNFSGEMTRMPEFTAPKLGTFANLVTIDADIPANANGVLYALGAFSGGLSLFTKDGHLCYEYNLFEINRTKVCSTEKLPTGKVKIEVDTAFPAKRPGSAADITAKVNGSTFLQAKVPVTVPITFTANDALDIGTDLGSPVSPDYYDKAPFKFNGKITSVNIKYSK